MAAINNACETCNPKVNAVFNPGTGTRDIEIIPGDLHTTEQCFVRDEIRFLNTGRLIFDPVKDPATGQEMGQYFRDYFVICRKLVVVGGHKPGSFNPCGSDDPGTEYTNNNVITWLDRLHAAAAGPAHANTAADGTSFNSNNWSDQGQGDSGKDGGNGTTGATGHNGGDGKNAPHSITLIALEVEMGFGDNLTLDWDGQTGGDGGKGQRGGKGGTGMGGKIGDSDTSWPGTGCDRQPGHGGNGGNGGDGGKGGNGGSGGDAGGIFIVSTHANVTSGPLVGGNVTYVNDGATGGGAGKTGVGGNGGLPGHAGFKTSECDQASDGAPGGDGSPAPLSGADPNPGSPGSHGANGALKFEELPATGTCADIIPLPVTLDAAGLPLHLCRGFSTPATVDASVTGHNLEQVSSLDASLANITINKKITSTDTQLDLQFNLAGNSGLGNGSLILHRDFGPNHTQPNAINVEKFQVTGVAPNSGAKNTQVNVTITGTCFDPSALLQQVIVSGFGVTVLNILIVDEHTVTCVFDISAVAGANARDVTVKTGLSQHTLTNAFSVTP